MTAPFFAQSHRPMPARRRVEDGKPGAGLRRALVVAQTVVVAWCAARVIADLRAGALGFEGWLAVTLGAGFLVWMSRVAVRRTGSRVSDRGGPRS